MPILNRVYEKSAGRYVYVGGRLTDILPAKSKTKDGTDEHGAKRPARVA